MAATRPSVCGATPSSACSRARGRNPSVRVRGYPQGADSCPFCLQPVRPCAGLPRRAPPPRLTPATRPSVCGATCIPVLHRLARRNPSVRVRGYQIVHLIREDIGEPVRPCAGLPGGCYGRQMRRGTRPSVCGATTPHLLHRRDVRNPSVRVRGYRTPGIIRRWLAKPVRPCAGLPGPDLLAVQPLRTRPSVCGATRRQGEAHLGDANPSVRVRGYRRTPRPAGRWPQPVRPCAGLPGGLLLAATELSTRPSVCGATGYGGRPALPDLNPSVRVRGYPLTWEPPAEDIATRPSVCGATPPSPRPRSGGGNPSVRVRGYLRRRTADRIFVKPVRPCAGLPQPRYRNHLLGGTRPSVCGATACSSRAASSKCNPSVRVRGYRRRREKTQNIFEPVRPCAGLPPQCMI